jgi:hypothetical protein
MPRAGFEPTIPANQAANTYYALDRAATGTNIYTMNVSNILWLICERELLSNMLTH